MADDPQNPLTTPDPNLPQRTETGEIKDSQAKPIVDTKSPEPTSTVTESKASSGTDADGKSLLNKDGKPADAPQGAPEKYEAFKAPDGYELDAKAIEQASPIFKELGLNQSQAQQLVDLYIKQTTAATEAPFKLYAEMRKAWEDEVRGEFGKDIEPGGKVLTTIARVIDTLPPKVASGFREAMDITGAGSHPAFIKAFYAFAQALGEGQPVKGNGPSVLGQKDNTKAAPPSAAKAMYPNLPSIYDEAPAR